MKGTIWRHLKRGLVALSYFDMFLLVRVQFGNCVKYGVAHKRPNTVFAFIFELPDKTKTYKSYEVYIFTGTITEY